MTRTLVAALALLLLVACGGAPAAQPLRMNAAPWSDGERAVYRVSSQGDYVGTAEFMTTRQGEDAQEWTVRREVTGRGDQEIVVVLLSDTGLRPVESTLVRILPAGVEQVHAVYDGSEVNLDLTTRTNATTFQQLRVPTDARDQHALPFLVRALPLAQGYSTRMNTLLPITGNLERVIVTVTGAERVTVPAGTFDTWKVSLQIGDSTSYIWIEVAAPHQVIKYEDARARALYELENVTSGAPESL